MGLLRTYVHKLYSLECSYINYCVVSTYSCLKDCVAAHLAGSNEDCSWHTAAHSDGMKTAMLSGTDFFTSHEALSMRRPIVLLQVVVNVSPKSRCSRASHKPHYADLSLILRSRSLSSRYAHKFQRKKEKSYDASDSVAHVSEAAEEQLFGRGDLSIEARHKG